MQTTKKVFSSALLALATAILLPSCATTGTGTAATGPGNLKYGLPVPYHTGYVRSPYTRPAQLVNLNGAQPGEIITCPYTGNDFIVPGLTGKRFQERQERLKQAQSRRALAATQTKTQKTNPAPVPVKPEAAAAPTPKPRPAATTPEHLQPRMITPTEEPITADELLAAPAATRSEIPFGTNIPGKPGFVRSPYAAAHQLVDVSGLPVGSEVKCPYTNKIFRVPAP